MSKTWKDAFDAWWNEFAPIHYRGQDDNSDLAERAYAAGRDCGRAEMQAEVNQLQKDARRYRWLVSQEPRILSSIAYRISIALDFSVDDPDACVDAAIAGSEVISEAE